MNAPRPSLSHDDSPPTHPDVVVLIPAFNESESLPLVLDALPDVARVIVANNNSTDNTAKVAVAHGAHVVNAPQQGYGAACLQALAELDRLIVSEQLDVSIVVFVDGDFSDHPEELPLLIDPIQRNQADFVIGSRLTGNLQEGAMPPQSYYGNKLACWLMKCFFGATYTDLGPFRAIRYDTLKQLHMVDENFGWTVEMQIKAIRQKIRVQEVPVSYRKRIGVSKISGTISGTFRAGYKILYLIARYGFFVPAHVNSSHAE